MLVALAPPLAHAEPKPDLVVRVVDVQDVMAKSKAMIGIRKKLSDYRQKYDAEFAQKEKELQQEERELVKQRALVDADVFRKNAQAFQAKYANFKKELNKRQQQLQASYATASNDVRRQMRKVWVDVANDEGATLILPRMQVLLFSPQFDVTAEVIKRLNQTVPSVNFPDPMSFGNDAKSPSAKPSK